MEDKNNVIKDEKTRKFATNFKRGLYYTFYFGIAIYRVIRLIIDFFRNNKTKINAIKEDKNNGNNI